MCGLHAVSLQPAAGSQGELTGLMLMRAYFADRGEAEQRRVVITADTAHGTNPASVAMAGFELQKVETDERGNLDLDDLRAKVDERTAGLMLTNPSTLGLFDEHIEEVSEIFHDAGALLYYDGANLNAVCGISRPGRHGLRHRPHQPAQDVLPAARRRRAGRRADRGARHPGAVPAGAGGRARGRCLPARLRPAADDRQGARLLRAVRRVRALVRVHPRVRAGACARCRRRRC